MANELYELSIGERANIKVGWLTSETVVYAGMLNDNIFSLVRLDDSTTGGHGYNLYIPKTQKEISFESGKLRINEVNAEKIILQYIK